MQTRFLSSNAQCSEYLGGTLPGILLVISAQDHLLQPKMRSCALSQITSTRGASMQLRIAFAGILSLSSA